MFYKKKKSHGTVETLFERLRATVTRGGGGVNYKPLDCQEEKRREGCGGKTEPWGRWGAKAWWEHRE